MNKLGKLLLISGLSIGLLTGCSNSTNDKDKTDNSTATKEWSYEGSTGPSNWESLGFIKGGMEQSPINIETTKTMPATTTNNETINYATSAFKFLNNGHTIEAVPEDTNNTVVIDGTTYTLAQFHFHAPSEHQVNGENFAMELHLVNKDANGNIAVFGVLIKEGSENTELAELYSKLPKDKMSEEEAIALTKEINLANLLPANKAKYEYKGSLTTPPATQGVKWFVFEQPIEMSKDQISKFKAIFKDNHRPVQPLNDREVYVD